VPFYSQIPWYIPVLPLGKEKLTHYSSTVWLHPVSPTLSRNRSTPCRISLNVPRWTVCGGYRRMISLPLRKSWSRLHHSQYQVYPLESVSLPSSSNNEWKADRSSDQIRPTFGRPSIPSDPSSLLFQSPNRLSSPPNQLPILITSTANEAGQIVQSLFPSPVPSSNSTLLSTLSFLVGEEKAAALMISGKYRLGTGGDAFRETLEKIVTDGI